MSVRRRCGTHQYPARLVASVLSDVRATSQSQRDSAMWASGFRNPIRGWMLSDVGLWCKSTLRHDRSRTSGPEAHVVEGDEQWGSAGHLDFESVFVDRYDLD